MFEVKRVHLCTRERGKDRGMLTLSEGKCGRDAAVKTHSEQMPRAL